MALLLNNVLFPIKGFIIALLLCIVFMPFIIHFIKKQKWLDQPNQRKIHKVPIPTLGGIVIFLSMLIVVLAHPGLMTTDIIVVLSSSGIFLITGIIDDLKDIRPRLKLYIQIGGALIVFFYGIRIEDIPFLGIYNLNWQLSLMLSVLCIVFFINAFNLIDGIDGLAGGLSIITLSSFTALFYFSEVYDFAFLSAIMAGSCLGFLFFNFNPARIFMGNTGSLTIGFLLAVFAVRAMQLPQEIFYGSFKIDTFSVVIALVLLPSIDAVRVFITRMIKGISPFTPDKTHIHHLMLSLGMTHKSASLTLYSIQILTLITAFFPPPFITSLILLGFIVMGIISHKIYRKYSHEKVFFAFRHEKHRKNNNVYFKEQILNAQDSKLDTKHVNHFKNKYIIEKFDKKEIENISDLKKTPTESN